MRKILLLLLSCLLFASSSSAHRILGIFPHPGHSHFQFFHPIMKALAEAGHEVTVVSEFPNKEPIENYNDELLSSESNGLVNAVSLEVNFVVKFKVKNSKLKIILALQLSACDSASNGVFYAARLGTRSMCKNLKFICNQKRAQ